MDKARESSLEKQIAQLTRLVEKNHKVYLMYFDQIDRRFGHVDQRFEDMEQSFDKRMKHLEQKFEKHTQASEIRSTNLLNICTALRSDMRSLRTEWGQFLKKQEERELESRPLLS